MATVTTHTSWFSRIGTSLKGILLGLFLIVGAIWLLVWNEGRAISTYQSLKEGASVVEPISAETVDPTFEGKLIHFSGESRTAAPLSDAEFAMSQSALKMRRIVEMYQWTEHAKSTTVEKLGGGTETTTTYSYEKKWSDQIVDSQSFQEASSHQNPTAKLFESREWIADTVSVGAFTLPESMIRSLSGYTEATITADQLTSLPYERQSSLELLSNTLYWETEDPQNPAIGDIRIRYEFIPTQSVSVIGQQAGMSVKPFATRNDKTILMMQLGVVSAEAMFQGAISGNQMLTLGVRLLGAVLLFAAFKMILDPIRILSSLVPFIGKIVGMGTGLIAGVLAAIVSLVVIALAWLAVRPLLSGILLLAAVALAFAASAARKRFMTSS